MNTETQNTTDSKIHLKNVRLSYPHLFVPQIQKGSTKAKFGADLLLDKKLHAGAIKKIEELIKRVALDRFKKDVKLKPDKVCLHDGNEHEDKDGYGDEVMFLVAKNTKSLPVVDRDPGVALVEKDGRPYGGCYVNAVVRIFAWEHDEGGKGVSASLEAVQFYKDGPAFGAGPVDAEAEFEKIADEADDY